MNDFLSWCMHLLVLFIIHTVTSLHPPSFYRNDFSTVPLFILDFGPKPQQNVARARKYYARACARGQPIRTRALQRRV